MQTITNNLNAKAVTLFVFAAGAILAVSYALTALENLKEQL